MNIRGAVVRAVDGDTVWVRVRVRLPRSTPELRSPGGLEALGATTRRFPTGRRVSILFHSVDDYGRIVGELVADDSGL